MVAEAEDKVTGSARVSLLSLSRLLTVWWRAALRSNKHTLLLDREVIDPMPEMLRALAGGQEQAAPH